MGVKRILICGFTSNCGGMESYVMNIYRNMDRSKLQFDFLYPYDEEIAFHDEIISLGGRIIYVPSRKKKPFKHYLNMYNLFNKNQYLALCYQCNRKLVTWEVFKFAKRAGIKNRIIHSHNSSSLKESFIHKLRETITEKRMDRYVTGRLACSDEAGRWMFQDRSFLVFPNTIDTNVFYYDPNIRKNLKNKMGLNDSLVLGTVGRLNEEKNPYFLVEIFNTYHKKHPDSHFIHVGSGPMVEEIKEKVKEYNLSNYYHFVGITDHVNDYLQMMDIFLLPSFYEGFPISLVEAQSTGLPCLVSSNVTKSVNITGNIQFASIESPEIWVEKIDDILKDFTRSDQSNAIQKAGYSNDKAVERVEEYFLN